MNSILKGFCEELGITSSHLSKNRLELSEQAPLKDLEVVDIDFLGRAFVITKETAKAWRQLCTAAASENVIIIPASGFRSYLYQKKIIANELAKGRTLDDILTSSAIPGFSEHHSGCAIDICADPNIPEDKFHETNAFAWMLGNAARFNFRLSYPQNNRYGMIFEPWHWLYTG